MHDFLLDLRGAERVFLALCEMWPQADIFTAIYDEAGTRGRFAARNVHTTGLQRFGLGARNFRTLAPLYWRAMETFNLSDYDLVVSSSSAWAHAVLCDETTLHVCYCHNPFRYAWNDREQTIARGPDPVSRAVLREWLGQWRRRDWLTAQRVHRYIANSRTTQARIRAFFGRDSEVVHPPVQLERFAPGRVGEHYALVSALMPHKHIELAVRAFNRLHLPLVVVGEGPDARRLRRLAGPTISFAGRLDDPGVAQVLSTCRALVMTSIEEFGIAAVEAQAAGRPVIARRGGGALETVIDGVTGGFWQGGEDELAAVVRGFDDAAIDPEACVGNAARFGIESFRRGMLAELSAAELRLPELVSTGPLPEPAVPRARRVARRPRD